MAWSLLSATLLVTAFACSVTAQTSGLKSSGKKLIADIRDLAARAKDGMPVKQLGKEVLEIQTFAADLLDTLLKKASDCEVQAVVKLAAAGVGSHEVLKLLTADDAMEVLDGRLALSLAVLEQMTQQLEDELTQSGDIAPVLAGIVFGTKYTAEITETADATVQEMEYLAQNDTDQAEVDSGNKRDKPAKSRRSIRWPPSWPRPEIPIPRPPITWPPGKPWVGKRDHFPTQGSPDGHLARRIVWPRPRPWPRPSPWPRPNPWPPGSPGPTFPRPTWRREVRESPKVPYAGLSEEQSGTNLVKRSATELTKRDWNLGRGWSLGLGGLTWQNAAGTTTFNAKPTFGSGGLGFSAGFTFRF